jgi:2-methylcitrate dehydratase PrpD
VFFERGLHATSICGAVGVAVAKGRFGFLQAFCGDRAHPDAVVRGLGTDWELPRVVKPYPCSHFTHAGVDTALRLRAQAGVPIEFHLHPSAPHGFELIAPTSEVALRSTQDRLRALQTL